MTKVKGKPHIFWYPGNSGPYAIKAGWRYYPALDHAYNEGLNAQANEWCIRMGDE